MKLSIALAVLPALSVVSAYSKQEYEVGAVHERLMSMKKSVWDGYRARGEHDSRKWRSWKKWSTGGAVKGRRDHIPCVNGLAVVEAGNANQTFRCKNASLQQSYGNAPYPEADFVLQMDLYDFASHADLGSYVGEGSSSWGWVSPDGREFAIIGQADGAAFAEISKKGKLIYLGRLPQLSVFSVWREIRVWKDYVVIGSEAVDHGIQFFDLKKLLTLSPSAPKNFSTSTDVDGLFTALPRGRTHNVVINHDFDYAMSVGAQPRNDSCRSGIIFIDLQDPTAPVTPGCAGNDGYVHDAQCVRYHGPDTRYEGRDICIGYNEDTITVYDATVKTGVNGSTIISRTPYYGASYTHQGWFIEENWHQYLILDDELDEVDMVGLAANQIPVTYIFDMSDLENPVNTGHYYSSDVKSIDHNIYVYDGLAYHSNYGSGLRVHDVTSIPSDPTGASVEEIGFFDIYPEDDHLPGGGVAEFVGTWSHYEFPSGYIFVNTIERGGWVVKLNKFGARGYGKWRN